MDAPKVSWGTVRRYGKAPFRIVLVHGGPGDLGSMAPVARELARTVGVVEPWQTARTVAGQVEELSCQIDARATTPVTLIGHSWGAWLTLLFGARFPEKTRRLILVGSGPLSARYAAEIRRRRKARLSPAQGKEFEDLLRRLVAGSSRAAPAIFHRLGELEDAADSYELVPGRPRGGRADVTALRSVWPEAEEMRRSGRLLREIQRVKAPITVVHGSFDPHPVEGVVNPLRKVGLPVRCILLESCGHAPWRERYARERFFDVLRAEVARDRP